ncbi:MAG: DUF7305 domain-containing protein [Eubacteriaceae bacterium]
MKDKSKEKGMVLVLVVIFGAILIMSGTALLTTGVVEVRSGNYFEDDTQAYFIAKSAADMLAQQIVNKSVNINSYPATFSGSIQGNTYAINVTKEDDIITINSTGFSDGVDDNIQFLLRENSNTNASYEFDMAIFSKGNITMKGKNTIVNGNIATNSTQGNAVEIHNSGSVNGTIFVGAGGNPDLVINKDVEKSGNLAENRIYPTPIMPEFPAGYTTYQQITNPLTMTENVFIEEINSSNLTIDVGNEDRVIVVNNLSINNLKVVGTGTLTIHTNKISKLKGDINWDTLDRSKLHLYYHGNNEIDLTGNANFCGYFQTDLAPIKLSGNSNFWGVIITATTSEIKLSGSNNTYANVLYAPNASVKMSGGGKSDKFKGSIISSEITMSGNAGVTYASAGSITIPTSGGGGSTTYEELYYK